MLEAPNLLEQFSASLVKDHVNIVDFAEDSKYLGFRLYPRQRTLLKIIFLEELDAYDKAVIEEWLDPETPVEVGPKLFDRIDYLKDNNYNHFRTVQLIGGRRSGKGFMTAIAIAYKAFQLTQLESKTRHEFGIEDAGEVYFSIVANSIEQAKAFQFANAKEAITRCKPFQDQRLISMVLAEHVSLFTPQDIRRANVLKRQGIKVDSDMASIKVRAFGNNSKSIRGSASIMAVFDEMAHLIAGDSRLSDAELWKAVMPSLAQFKSEAMVFANSSPYQKTGQFFELYEQSLQLDPPETGKPVYPDHFMIRYPSWEMYKDWDRDTSIRSAPYNKARGPQILDPVDDPILAREEQADPETFRVEYRSEFAEVIDAYLDPAMVDRVFDPAWAKRWMSKELMPQAGAVAFGRYKGHADPAAFDANFGIAIGHTETLTDSLTGITEQHVIFDLIDAFYPEDFQEDGRGRKAIDWLEVVPTITQLINAFRPYEFTFDQFDSRMAIQQLQDNLRKMAIGETVVYEIFATPKVNMMRANNFKAAINLGRVHAPHPDTFNPIAVRNSIELGRNELKFLQVKNGRVDKQTIGPVKTKDIADCMMEVVNALIGDSISMGQTDLLTGPPQFGAQGGYSLSKMGNTDQFGEMNGLYKQTGRDYSRNSMFMPERGMRRDRRKRS